MGSVMECGFFNPHTVGCALLGVDTTEGRGVVKTLSPDNLTKVRQLAEIVKGKDILNSRDGRDLRCAEIGGGEVTHIVVHQDVVVGNHRHDDGKLEIFIITEGNRDIEMAQSDPEGHERVYKTMRCGQLTFSQNRDGHAFKLSAGTELLILCSSGWGPTPMIEPPLLPRVEEAKIERAA